MSMPTTPERLAHAADALATAAEGIDRQAHAVQRQGRFLLLAVVVGAILAAIILILVLQLGGIGRSNQDFARRITDVAERIEECTTPPSNGEPPGECFGDLVEAGTKARAEEVAQLSEQARQLASLNERLDAFEQLLRDIEVTVETAPGPEPQGHGHTRTTVVVPGTLPPSAGPAPPPTPVPVPPPTTAPLPPRPILIPEDDDSLVCNLLGLGCH